MISNFFLSRAILFVLHPVFNLTRYVKYSHDIWSHISSSNNAIRTAYSFNLGCKVFGGYGDDKRN